MGLPTSQLRDSDVRYWSDFNRVYYNPKSIVQLQEYELNSQIMPFENWEAGEDLFQSLDKEFDLLDRDIRPFVEECDQMQGFQILTGADDAWGGLAAKYLDTLRDEYGKTSMWVWGIEDCTRVVRVSCCRLGGKWSTDNCTAKTITASVQHCKISQIDWPAGFRLCAHRSTTLHLTWICQPSVGV